MGGSSLRARRRLFGTCGECFYWRRVNTDGTMRVHRHVTDARRPDRCEGSGSQPKPCGDCLQPDCYLCTVNVP